MTQLGRCRQGWPGEQAVGGGRGEGVDASAAGATRVIGMPRPTRMGPRMEPPPMP